MLEKRRAIRYHVGEDTCIAIRRDEGELIAPLNDVSSTGLMATLPGAASLPLRPGSPVRGQLRWMGGSAQWQGRVVHRSQVSAGVGVGIAFVGPGAYSGEVRAAIAEVVSLPDAGGLCLERNEQGISLQIKGRLSFTTSQDCLAYVRRNAIAKIDLSQCRSIDSAGLGMLCIAGQRGIAIVGASGNVKSLLAIARISESEG